MNYGHFFVLKPFSRRHLHLVKRHVVIVNENDKTDNIRNIGGFRIWVPLTLSESPFTNRDTWIESSIFLSVTCFRKLETDS